MKVKKNVVIIMSIFLLSLMLITGQATIAFWSGAGVDWEERIYSPGLKGKVIILDAGHGGRDPGVVVDNVQEKDITLAIVTQLVPLLEKKGVKVYLTHNGNKGLISDRILTRRESIELTTERRNMVFEKKGSLLLSVHVNSFSDSKVRGPIVFYKENHPLNQVLAESLQIELNRAFNLERTTKTGNFVMLSQDTVPTALIEAGFLTNTKDRNFVTSKEGQEKIANALIKGLENYGNYLEELHNMKLEEENLEQEGTN